MLRLVGEGRGYLQPILLSTLARNARKGKKIVPIVSIVFENLRKLGWPLLGGEGCLEGLVKTFNKRVKMGQGQNGSK